MRQNKPNQDSPDLKPILTKRKLDQVAVASHQLSNPLAVIKAFIEALLDGQPGPLTDQQREYLTDALENVKDMICTTDNILSIARVEENQLELSLHPFYLEDIIEKSVKGFEPMLEATNTQVDYEHPPNPLPQVISDQTKIKQVIDNLISNAIKYHRKKALIKIKVNQVENQIKCEISDNGIGIPEEEQDKIFSKFFRGTQVLEMEPHGSGLGLYINKAIIEASGGQIGFSSQENKGTTFWFTLPTYNEEK